MPLLLGLVELDFLQEDEVPDLLQHLGLEVFYDFLSEQNGCMFFYNPLDEMPDFVLAYGHPMPVTPILLEASRHTDDWRSMKRVFPDTAKPVTPVDDLFARIAELDLGVLEIKLLAMINGETSPCQLAPAIGLPLFEVYRLLVRYACEGVIVPDGGQESLQQAAFALEDTMERAFEVLDANDDDLSRASALDDALGDPFADAKDPGPTGHAESFLDILANKDLSD